MDVKIAVAVAVESNNNNRVEYGSNVRRIAETETNLEELDERCEMVVAELNLFAVTQEDHFDEEYKFAKSNK